MPAEQPALKVPEERTTSTERPSRKRAGRTPRQRRRKIIAWSFMLPLVIVNVIVIVGPAIATIYYSFTEWSGIGPAEFVGLQNYRQMLTSGEFYGALLHNVIWLAIFLTVPIAMGLLGAFLLSQITRFQMLFRVVYFIPFVIASVVNCLNMGEPVRSGARHRARAGIHWFAVSGRRSLFRRPAAGATFSSIRGQLALVGLRARAVPDGDAVG